MIKKKVDNKEQISKINRFNILSVNIQVILTILTIIIFVLYIFNTKLLSILELLLGCSLLVMAFNNERIYKRKKVTIAYAVVGALIIFFDIVMLIGG